MLESIVAVFAIITLTSVLLSCYALHRSVEAQIEVKAMKASTHQVQFVPLETPTPGQSDEEISAAMDKEQAKAWDKAMDLASEPLS